MRTAAKEEPAPPGCPRYRGLSSLLFDPRAALEDKDRDTKTNRQHVAAGLHPTDRERYEMRCEGFHRDPKTPAAGRRRREVECCSAHLPLHDRRTHSEWRLQSGLAGT